jgi:hypothetical protein
VRLNGSLAQVCIKLLTRVSVQRAADSGAETSRAGSTPDVLIIRGMTACGPSPTWCDVRCSVAVRSKADATRTSDFGRD